MERLVRRNSAAARTAKRYPMAGLRDIAGIEAATGVRTETPIGWSVTNLGPRFNFRRRELYRRIYIPIMRGCLNFRPDKKHADGKRDGGRNPWREACVPTFKNRWHAHRGF